MPWINAVVGLPGSGKTRFLKDKLDSAYNKQAVTLFDDPTKESRPKIVEEMAIHKTHNIYIADCHLCLAKNREVLVEIARDHDYHICWYFYENDPEQCLKNVAGRDDRKVEETIKYLSKRYAIPEVDPLHIKYVLPVWGSQKGSVHF